MCVVELLKYVFFGLLKQSCRFYNSREHSGKNGKDLAGQLKNVIDAKTCFMFVSNAIKLLNCSVQTSEIDVKEKVTARRRKSCVRLRSHVV